MKRVISFSLWGENPLYVEGMLRNAEDAKKFYPGWVVRCYLGDKVPVYAREALINAGVEIVLKPSEYDCLGLYWRFSPMFDDPEVERFIVRDSDSRFTQREVDAVNYWIESGKPFHIIRDCESHGMLILGGTWGAIPGCVPNFSEKLSLWLQNLRPEVNNPRGKFHGTDQEFLSWFVWPKIYDNHVAHVRAGIPKIKFTINDIDLPELTDGHYVGMVC